MRTWSGELQSRYDVVVIGSGAGGLTAALCASTGGASVALLEKADHIGGTTAVSGGMIWVPCNLRMAELGIPDSRDDAVQYLTRVAGGRTAPELVEAVVDGGRSMQEFVEGASDLRFSTLAAFPDYHPEWPGSHPGGRSLEPDPFDATAMGSLFDSLRPDHRPPFTMAEYEEWRIFTRFPWDMLDERAKKGFVSRGRALVAPLLAACAAAGVTIATGSAARRLLTEPGSGVVGVRTDDADIHAGAVVLASGGFEWDEAFCTQFLAGDVQGSCSPPHNTGDGIRMASALGAKLGNMSEAWWGPMVHLPGDETDGAPTSTLLRFERTGPHTVMVDRHGRRFMNEAHNYNDVTKVFHAFDPRDYRPMHQPVRLIFDQRHLDSYGFLTHRSGEPTPEWLVEAPTIEALAAALALDPGALRETVDRFNANAVTGVDPDYHRGESAYDRYWGDVEAPHPALGPVDAPPFYAIEVFSGVIGTKGGLTTDARARVLDVWDDPIPGLYATGNTTAHPMGIGYAGAGSTLGPAMTLGWTAGNAITGSG